MSLCNGMATTGEELGPYDTQSPKTFGRAMRVKDKSESDIRIDPTNARHLIGQAKWAVNGEAYNHLLGFYESFDGGRTWPVQGHVPGYEGWTDNTDPIGAFDPWGNFYSLVLPYQFYYDKFGFKKYDNGSKQTNPTVPPEAIAMAVHPSKTLPGKTPAASWIVTHKGQPDYIMTADNADTNVPDKQWLTIDTNPGSPHYGRVYAMWTLFVFNPSVIYESHADGGRRHAFGLVAAANPADRLRQALGCLHAAAGNARRHGVDDDHAQSAEAGFFARRRFADLVEGWRRNLARGAAAGGQGINVPTFKTPRSAKASSTHSGLVLLRQAATIRFTSLPRGRHAGACPPLSDGVLRQRQDVVGAHSDQRQSDRHRGDAAQSRRGAERNRRRFLL
jgi:hypothetical protein